MTYYYRKGGKLSRLQQEILHYSRPRRHERMQALEYYGLIQMLNDTQHAVGRASQQCCQTVMLKQKPLRLLSAPRGKQLAVNRGVP